MDVAALRTALGRIGFSNQAATAITTVQQIDSVEELGLLEDEAVYNLCKVTRKPGGTITNNAAVVGAPANISDPGTQVSLRAENNLKLTAYWLRHRVRTSRATTAADITLVNIRTVRELLKTEKANVNPVPPVIDDRDWPKTMEAIREWLRTYLGESGIPLAYVIRDEVDIPAGPDPAGIIQVCRMK